MKDYMQLEIISPEKTLYAGEVEKVLLPGSKAPFMVLANHAPMISLLQKGEIVWNTQTGESRIAVSGGVVEVKDNLITVCTE
jgi:F-type H+-transporting ATPase subunit epsilon